jgi:outer membrane protein assembly factor BamB
MRTRFLLILLVITALFSGCMSYQKGPSFEPTKEGLGWDYGSSLMMGARFTASPVLVNDRIYLASLDGSIYTVESAHGKLLDKKDFVFKIPQGIRSTPVPNEGILYFGAFDNNVHGIDALTGQERFSFETNGYISASPIIRDNILYIGSYDGIFRAIDLSSKQQKWAYDSKAKIEGVASFSDTGVIFANADGKVFHLDRTSGSVLWQKEFGADIYAGTVTAGSLVLFADKDAYLRALNIVDGSTYWEFKAPKDSQPYKEEFWTLPAVFINPSSDKAPATTPAVQEIVPTVSDSAIQADEPSTQPVDSTVPPADAVNETSDISNPVAQTDADDQPAEVLVVPTYEDSVFIGSSLGLFYAFKLNPKSGQPEMLWDKPFDINAVLQTDKSITSTTAEYIFSTAVVKDGRVFFGSNDSHLYCVDQKTGQVIWDYPSFGEIRCTPLLINDMVVFVSNDHYFYGLNIEDGTPIRGQNGQ